MDNQASVDAVAARSRVVRDDRVLPITRFLGIAVPPFLVAAFIILYIFPGSTKQFFAWEIHPDMTPLLMGGGYISGGYYFLRVLRAQRWHQVGLGLTAITAFTWFMLLSTLLHWDKFTGSPLSFDSLFHPEKFTASPVSFYAWSFLYFITPFLVPIVYFLNRPYDPGTPDPDDVIVPSTIRLGVGITGAVILAIAVFLFLFPDTAIAIWPWKLTLLTARVVGGWFALPGVVAVAFASDRRWSAWRITLQSQLIGIALILLGVPRAWGDFMQDRPMTWVFIVGMLLLLVGLFVLYLYMEGQRRRVLAGAPSQA